MTKIIKIDENGNPEYIKDSPDLNDGLIILFSVIAFMLLVGLVVLYIEAK
jgi:hypothetical protein